jgi:diaminopimelate decarboxylase
MTDHFHYRDGQLHVEDVAVWRIAAAVGTPFYVYSNAALEQQYRRFAGAFTGMDARVHFAMKANSNMAVVRTLAQLGAGADVVSEGELRIALDSGVPADRIVFSGVGKTEGELAFALHSGIYQINVESEPELEALSRVAVKLGKTAPVTLRVNPDVDPETHAKIATGYSGTKFGIPWTDAPRLYAKAATLPGIDVVGVDVHIGSQLTKLDPFRIAFGRVARLIQDLRAQGINIRRADLGGGLGIVYNRQSNSEAPPDPTTYAALVKETFGPLGVQVLFEPGRFLVGNAGLLIGRVIYVKSADEKTFYIVDAAMNDLIRPTLYDAWHDVQPVREPEPDHQPATVDVVGPVCETGDLLAADRVLPPMAAGDLLAIRSAGAYAAVMASTYNARPLVPEVMVRGGEFATVRRRPSYEEMTRLEALPPWLEPDADGGRRAGTG